MIFHFTTFELHFIYVYNKNLLENLIYKIELYSYIR